MGESKRVNEIEISIRDLFYYCISRWRALIIWFVIGAVLGAGVGIYRNSKETQPGIYQETSVLKAQLSDWEVTVSESAETNLLYFINTYENQMDFIKNSAFQQLNPYAINTVELKYLIQNGDENSLKEDETAIVQAFASLLTGKELEQALSKVFPNEKNLRYYYEGTVIANTELQENGILTVCIYNDDDELLDKISNAVKETLVDKKTDVESKVGATSVVLISETKMIKNDPELYDAQQKNITDLDVIKKNIKTVLSDLNSSERVYVENLIYNNCDSEYKNIVVNTNVQPVRGIKQNKKWILLGAIAGLIIALLCIVVKYIAAKKLRTIEDLEEMGSIPRISTISAGNPSKKQHNTKLDKALWAKRVGRNNKTLEENVALTATKLVMMAEHKGMKKVCVAIGKDVVLDAQFMDDIVKACGDKIEVSVVNDLTENATSMQVMEKADGLVIVEQIDKSKYANIAMEVQICSNTGINIIGAIIVE